MVNTCLNIIKYAEVKNNFVVTLTLQACYRTLKLLKFIIQKSKPMKHAGINRARELSWDFNETV